MLLWNIFWNAKFNIWLILDKNTSNNNKSPISIQRVINALISYFYVIQHNSYDTIDFIKKYIFISKTSVNLDASKFVFNIDVYKLMNSCKSVGDNNLKPPSRVTTKICILITTTCFRFERKVDITQDIPIIILKMGRDT